VALNITCANRVILTDPWWNSSAELQAYCRVFRIGQKKTTHFVSLLAEKTIDARISRLQQAKLQNVEQALMRRKSIPLEEFASLLGNLTQDENGNAVIVSDFPEEQS
jgi:SNF2 family DNA or RNA helicase